MELMETEVKYDRISWKFVRLTEVDIYLIYLYSKVHSLWFNQNLSTKQYSFPADTLYFQIKSQANKTVWMCRFSILL